MSTRNPRTRRKNLSSSSLSSNSVSTCAQHTHVGRKGRSGVSSEQVAAHQKHLSLEGRVGRALAAWVRCSCSALFPARARAARGVGMHRSRRGRGQALEGELWKRLGRAMAGVRGSRAVPRFGRPKPQHTGGSLRAESGSECAVMGRQRARE